MKKHTAARWRKELKAASSNESKWRTEARRIVKKYRDDKKDAKQDFNILYSNVQTIKPAVFSSTPRPDVRRRYKDENELAKNTSEMLERALTFSIDRYDFDATVSKTVMDMLLPGRGLARLRYEPIFDDVDVEVPFDDVDEFGNPFTMFEVESQEQLVSEDVMCEYVYWEDFRIEPVRNWEDVTWIAFKHKFTKEAFIEEFGEKKLDGVEFSFSITDDSEEKGIGSAKEEENKLAIVWEIWNKPDRKLIWIAEGKNAILEKGKDPLNLEGFFPIPKPLFAIETTDTLVPVPDYSIYESLDRELNVIQQRIKKLTEGLKVRGVYPKAFDEMERMLSLNDNEMVGIEKFDVFSNPGGLEKFVMFAPIQDIAQVIANLREQRDAVKQTIFEVTGISDILRGASRASETATAQRIKSSFGTLRLDERKNAVAVFARDLLRIKAEIIAENFQPETLTQMTGIEVTPEMQELLQSDLMRAYNIDIETDSTVSVDKSQEKAEAREILEGMIAYMNGMAPLVQGGAIPIDTAKDILLWAVRSFRGGRAIEEAIERIGGEEGEDPGEEGEDPNAAAAQMQQLQGQVQQMQQQLQVTGEENQQLKATAEQGQLDQQKQEIAKTQEMFKKDVEIAQLKNPQIQVEGGGITTPQDQVMQVLGALSQENQMIAQAITQMAQAVADLTKPQSIEVIRDDTGRIVGGVKHVDGQEIGVSIE